MSAPGRVNLIGEHIDYHGLPVLPMAIGRRITITFRVREDTLVRAVSDKAQGLRTFGLADTGGEHAGDWGGYLKAAAQGVRSGWTVPLGIDAAIESDLPEAAGLSSSSALVTAFALALLHGNGIRPTFSDLMSILPEAERFVGTRGGGMDHAAILAASPGHALLVGFDPLATAPVPIPPGWKFLVAHSLTRAHKSGELRAEYNGRREAGNRALRKLRIESYAEALDPIPAERLDTLEDAERSAFLHVTEEALRVREAVRCLYERNAERFGDLLTESHRSLRDHLRVSTPALDRLVELALSAGAKGARLTGAGFGGCAVIFCMDRQVEAIREMLLREYYLGQPQFNEQDHLFLAEPSAGALT